MKKNILFTGAAIAALACAAIPVMGFASTRHAVSFAAPAAALGQPAPDFSLTDVNGKSVDLTQYSGKIVVLEWTNNTCPFVKKHYNSGNMQKLQKWATGQGVVWLTIVSSAPGNQGYVTPAEGAAISKKEHAAATDKLLDPDGTVGHLYDAKTTPDMRIIDSKGVLVYSGGIDDKPTPDPESIGTAHNYVKAALEELLAGKPVTTQSSQPYGCSVKYKS